MGKRCKGFKALVDYLENIMPGFCSNGSFSDHLTFLFAHLSNNKSWESINTKIKIIINKLKAERENEVFLKILGYLFEKTEEFSTINGVNPLDDKPQFLQKKILNIKAIENLEKMS